jgi:uncharacterized protein
MDEIEIFEKKNVDLSNSMLVVAFPTVGLISSIVGHYIIDTLNLEEVGSIVSRYFSPTAIIHKSRPSPPVRIYAGKKICGPDGSCEQLTVIISEFMPPLEIIKPLSDKIFEWSKEKNCKIITTLEGTHALGDRKAKNVNVFGIGSNNKMNQIIKKHKIKLTKEGMVTGVTGVLLYGGVLLDRDVICLLAEAHSSYPDSRAAAALLEKLDIMLPLIKIDPTPLYEEAEKIEENIKKFMEQSKPTAPGITSTPTQMYG